MATVGLGSGATPTAFTNDDKEPMTVKQECECQQYPRSVIFLLLFFAYYHPAAGANGLGSLAILLLQCPSRPLRRNGVSKKKKDILNCCRYFYLFHSISIKRK